MFGDIITDLGGILQGGMGVAAGGNLNPDSGGVSMFEPMGGSAPKYAGQDKVNPSSVILSGEMMLRHLGWFEAADLIQNGMNKTFTQKKVTYDFARQMENATLLKCSEFGDAIISNM